MRMYDVIKKKRDNLALTDEEIRFFIEGYVKGEIPDYQASALLMAIYFNGMNEEEITSLTFAVRDSGEILDFSNVNGLRVDKHSTGGVGDKTSLVVAPIVASLGVKVAKMSGRGLGHTGGTIDKLESITGFKTNLPIEEFVEIVNKTGIAIVGQNADLAPADKKLYALRDVTATVDSLPLIVSSIMGKKLAADDDCIVLDVKTGSGSFMKTVEDSEKLARLMVKIGESAGKKMLAIITDMDVPLGFAIGNALEVKEAIATLSGNGPEDFTSVCIELATSMLHLAEHGSEEECRAMVLESIKSGKALNTLREMVKAQGGDVNLIDNPQCFKQAKYERKVFAQSDGYIVKVDCEGYGIASLLLGAGRNTKEDEIDYSAGIILNAKTGDYLKKGDLIATLYSDNQDLFEKSQEKLLESTVLGENPPVKRPLILSKIK